MQRTTKVYSKPHPVRGYLYIAGATFLWAVAVILGRAVFTGRLLPSDDTVTEIEPVILSQTRNTFTFVALLLMLGMKRGWSALPVPRSDRLKFLMLGVLGLTGANYFYYVAIQRTNVATATILQYTAPVWVLVYLAFRWRRWPALRQIVGVALALTGIALLIDLLGAGQFRLDRNGVIAGILSAFAFAFYNIGAHDILKRYDRWILLLYVTGGAALFWLVINPPWRVWAAEYTAGQWLFMVVFAAVSALVPFALYAAGLQHLEPPRAMIAACTEPVFAIALAALTLGEFVRPLQLVGILLVLAAIVAVEWPGGNKLARKTAEEAAVDPIE